MAPPPRTNNLDFLRFLFASLVVLSHCWPVGGAGEEHEPLKVLTRGQLTMGELSVDSFFIISGFLITHSWMRQPRMWPFLKKRIARIHPGFIAASIVSVFLVAPLCSTQGYGALKWRDLGEFMLHAFWLRCYSSSNAFTTNPVPNFVNVSLWSIPFEFWCYIGVLLLGVSAQLRRRNCLAVCCGLSIVGSFAFAWYQLGANWGMVATLFGSPSLWSRLLPYFLSGMVFYLWQDEIPLSWRGALGGLLLLALAARVPHGILWTLPLAGAYLIFWVASLSLGRLHRWGAHGDFSYGIYLYAFPIQQVIVYCHGSHMAPWKLFLLSWPASLFAAVLSWHLVEKHWLLRARRTAIGPPVAHAPAEPVRS